MVRSAGKKASRTNNELTAQRNGAFRILRVKKGADLKTLYAKVRAAFTAEALQRYTQDEEMIPAEQLAKELDAMGRRERKRKVKRK